MKKIISFIPALIWMVIIFYFSSQSTTGIGTNRLDRFLIFKSFHLIEYAILAILISIPIKNRNYVILISYLYALSDELHQSFVPGRSGKFEDTLIDLVGIFIGVYIFNKILKKKLHPLY